MMVWWSFDDCLMIVCLLCLLIMIMFDNYAYVWWVFDDCLMIVWWLCLIIMSCLIIMFMFYDYFYHHQKIIKNCSIAIIIKHHQKNKKQLSSNIIKHAFDDRSSNVIWHHQKTIKEIIKDPGPADTLMPISLYTFL